MPRGTLQLAADRVKQVAREQALAVHPRPERFRVTATEPLELEGLSTDTLLNAEDDDVEVAVHVSGFSLSTGDIVWVQPEADPDGQAIVRWNVLSVGDSAGAFSVPNASDVRKGVTLLSLAPADPGNPVAVGANDPRLGDARPPSGAAGGMLTGTYPNPSIASGIITNALISATAAIAESKLSLASDAAAATPSRRTLGTGPLQAASGNDPRFSDSRVPAGAAGGVLSGTYPNPGLASSVTLPGTPTLGTAPTWPDSSAAVASTGFVSTAIGTRAPATLGVVALADYPRTTGEADDSGRFSRALTYGLATYPYGFTLLVPGGGYTVASFPSLAGSIGVMFQGVGHRASGGSSGTNITLTGAAARLVDLRGSYGFRSVGISWWYTNASHTGKVFDLSHSSGTSPANRDSDFGAFERAVISGSGGAVGASSLISFDNAHSHILRDVMLTNAVCAVRGKDAIGSYSNAITFINVHAGGTSQAPFQEGGDSWVFINPVGEPLADGSAGWYKSTFSTRSMAVTGGWLGDANGTGAWIDYKGAGLSIQGATISSAGTAVKLASSTYGVSITANTFDGNALVFDVGDSCQHLDLIPNDFATSNTAIIRYRDSGGALLALGTQGTIYASRVPPATNVISVNGDAKLAGTWYGDQMEFSGYAMAYRATANQVTLGRKDFTGTAAAGMVLGNNSALPYTAVWQNSLGQLVLDASRDADAALIVRNRSTAANSYSGIQFNDGAGTGQAFLGLAEGAGGVYTATGGYFRINPGAMPFRLLYSGTTIRLESDSNGLGFFGVTPAARPAATADLKAGLVSLGLATGGGYTPLDLGGSPTAGDSSTKAATTAFVQGERALNGFFAYRNAALSLASNGVIVFDTDSGSGFDPRNWYDTTTGRFTPQKAGYYRVHWAVGLNTSVTGNYCYAVLRKTSGGTTTNYADSQINYSGTAGLNTQGTTLVFMNGSTDYLDVLLVTNMTTPALTVGNTREVHFGAELVGT